MTFIKDPDVFKAVTFASSMIKKGTKPGLAAHRAAKYYSVSTSEVASHLGKRGSTVANRNRG